MAHRGSVSFCLEDLTSVKRKQKPAPKNTQNSHLLRSPRAKPQFNVILCRGPQSGRPHRAVWRAERVLFGVLSIKETEELWQFGILTMYSYRKSKLCRMSLCPPPPPFPKKIK